MVWSASDLGFKGLASRVHTVHVLGLVQFRV